MIEAYVQPAKRPTWWSTGHSAVPVPWMREFRYISNMFRGIENIAGDIVECGVGEGNTFSMLAYLIGSENRQPPRTLWGYDSFEGWPEPSPYDASPRKPEKGDWAISEEVTRKRLEESKVTSEFPNLDIRIIKGFLRDTLPSFPADRQIALLHIDVDLYEGYKDSLENLFPRVATGGIVLFDEYKEFPKREEYGFGTIEKWPGCSKAIDDYFSSLPVQQQIQHNREAKKYFVVKQ